MWSRARLAWCSLVGVLVVVLGVGVLCGSAGARVAGSSGGHVARGAEAGVARAAEAGALVLVGDGQGVPGCGKGDREDDGQRPAAPPRSPSSYELLPALYDTRAASGSWTAEQAVLTLSPGRAPPALVPPSPIDLSVLRV